MACALLVEHPMERFSPCPCRSWLEECLKLPVWASTWAYALASSHIFLSSVIGGAWCVARNSLCFAKPIFSSSVNSEKIKENENFNSGTHVQNQDVKVGVKLFIPCTQAHTITVGAFHSPKIPKILKR